MRFIVGLMIVGFAIAGTVFLFTAAREVVRRFLRRRQMVRAMGVVVDIVRRPFVLTGGVRRKTVIHNFPVIIFTTPSGESKRFTSEVGDQGDRSRYQINQQLAVRYDPEGGLPPMLDTWFAMWVPTLMGLLVGVGFWGAAAALIVLAGDRIVGR